MKKTIFTLIIATVLGLACHYSVKEPVAELENPLFISYVVNPHKQTLKFYWKDKDGRNYVDFQNLKTNLEKEQKTLLFAMNGGMYNKDLSPQGLYIENGQPLAEVDRTEKGYGNFFLQPNGIFYLTKNKKAVICKTSDFQNHDQVNYATQSGPMLLIDGKMHPKFTKGSANVGIRNGVGVLPNGDLLFAMSKEKINFYDFANYFKQEGCKNALYLDGFVSRTYLPANNWEQVDGNFGVIIGETKTL